MVNNKNVERYLWMFVVILVTYLLLGSFIVGKNYFDLAYLIVFYLFIIVLEILNRK